MAKYFQSAPYEATHLSAEGDVPRKIHFLFFFFPFARSQSTDRATFFLLVRSLLKISVRTHLSFIFKVFTYMNTFTKYCFKHCAHYKERRKILFPFMSISTCFILSYYSNDVIFCHVIPYWKVMGMQKKATRKSFDIIIPNSF